MRYWPKTIGNIFLSHPVKGNLTVSEQLEFLRTQTTSEEYLTQASNFSPEIRAILINFYEGPLYKKLEQM